MINRRLSFSLLALAAASVASATIRPGAFSEGSTTGGGGWKLTYVSVAEPALTSGQHMKIQTDATHTDAAGRPTVFHRFFTDTVNHTYFGYDLVVEPVGQTNAAVVKFQPLSLRGDQLPRKYSSTEYKAVGLPRFPVQTFKSGQTIAVDVLQNPANGQKVVDYIQVAFVPGGQGVTAALVPADIERAKSIGSSGAPVRIEIFSDFECPGCKAFHETVLPLLVREYAATGKALIVSREFPLPMHPHSREAASLATAAAAIGKYQPVADALFLYQQAWAASGKPWETVAPIFTSEEQKRVQEIAQMADVAALVQQDVDSGISQRVNSTPTLMISRGDKHYPFAGPGLANYPLLRSLLDQLLK